MFNASTIGLLLVAGLLHALWHSLVKFGAEREVVLVGMGAIAGAASSLALPFVSFPSPQVWSIIFGSVTLHVAYKFALARTYSLGEFGRAFPLARGFVPLFSTVIAFIVLGQVPSVPQLVGIGVVSAGLFLLTAQSLSLKNGPALAGLAPIIGLTVAGYGVLDAYGSRLSRDWFSFTAWLVVADSLIFGLALYAIKGSIVLKRLRAEWFRVVIAATLGLLSFSIFIWALSRNGVGAVAALRESSVFFAAVIGMVAH